MSGPISSEHTKSLLPYDYVKSRQIIAFQENGHCLVLSTAPIDLKTYHELSRYLEQNLKVEDCDHETFDQLITQVFSGENESGLLSEELGDGFDLKSFANSIAPTEDLLSGTDDAPIIKLINGIISQAIKQRASDIHFEPYEESFIVRFRIDGILRTVLTQDARIAPIVISRIKILSRLDISERRLPQDGRFSLSLGKKSVDVRVSTLPSSYGERIVLRLLDKESSQINIDDLGLNKLVLSNLKKTLRATEGMILVTGPTGSGKTTTLYASIRHINNQTQNILTVEDPVEYTLTGIGQTQVNNKTGYDFSTGLRSILRQDPDIVMLGEIRDEETARIAIQASLTGHLVLSTVHTTSAVGAITRLRDMGIESYLLASSIKTIIAQRLVRRLCEACKVSATISVSNADLLGLKAGSKTFMPEGCAQCDGSGYQGRIAIAESVLIDADMKNLIHEETSEQELQAFAFKKSDSIHEMGSDLIKTGMTSVNELIRLNNQAEDAGI